MRTIPTTVLAAALACGCATPTDRAVASAGVHVALRQATSIQVPDPPLLYVLSGSWEDYPEGKVVAVEGSMVAIALDDPHSVPPMDEHTLLTVRHDDMAIKGDAIVARHFEGVLLCRYFPHPFRTAADSSPVVGDKALVDRGTSAVVDDPSYPRKPRK